METTNIETHDHTRDHYDTRAAPTDLLACIVAVKGRQAPTGRSTLLGVLRHWASHSRDKTSDIQLKNHIEPKPKY